MTSGQTTSAAICAAALRKVLRNMLLSFCFPPYLQKNEYTSVAKKIFIWKIQRFLSQNNEYQKLKSFARNLNYFTKEAEGKICY